MALGVRSYYSVFRFLFVCLFLSKFRSSSGQRRALQESSEEADREADASAALPVTPSEANAAKVMGKPYTLVPPESGKQIPRIIWIAVRNASEELPPHLYAFFKRNPEWQVNIVGNDDKDAFINTIYDQTSTKWAYHKINPSLGAAKTDIWRYAALYLYGGLYLDYDSDIKTPLDQVVLPTDTLIVSEEGLEYVECYDPHFKLSNNATFTRFGDREKIASLLGNDYISSWTQTTPPRPLFFHGNSLINWAIFAAPRNPAFLRSLSNIAQLVNGEYHREAPVLMHKHTPHFKLLLCATMFVLTLSMRELLLESTLQNQNVSSDGGAGGGAAPSLAAFKPRVCQSDFKIYGGMCKAIWTGNDMSNYRKVMKTKQGKYLLAEYTRNLTRAVENLEGYCVSANAGGKSLFLVERGMKRPIGDMDMFFSLNLDLADVAHIADEVYFALPQGTPLEKKSLA